ncbi:peptide chain release factor N(5)-glutamine methyltransferase [Aestuariimicrobium sp. T2.26MG-19.2B]|uniref:peptide chain release factor N(5)-glutamine methyltransferase n=1 Tax=Aestuariimicrobium sp. T2.26MG-19.2B TaxID=3040679 RepID=UPI002477A5D9|nr:peptide chain release factor N(5)-glutamine methyltransferase [Aestuariimicrobium sp. T2.26MG-19.2B]CAI9410424.1 Release factor glutamine methyltransferase [Aestuariimicrobium sp. T2.26MG-19.2B]
MSVLRRLTRQLADAGSPSPEAEARTLLSHATGVPLDRLFLVGELSEQQQAALMAATRRRLAGEPVQHITGEVWFRHARLRVGPGVFVPRPETELLAGWAIDQLRGTRGRVVVELCAGSGAISRSIADEAPGHHQYAVEISETALTFARTNLAGTEVDLRAGDMADAFHDLDSGVDLLVVNPPYVPGPTRVPTEVHHDPAAAVFAGEDGLDAVRVVAEVAARLLRDGGVLGCEHDESHPEAVRGLFERAGLTRVETHADLVGRPRYTTAVAG